MVGQRLAELARQKGVPGMTRLYAGTHDVKGTYEELTTWFRDEGVFIGVKPNKIGDKQMYVAKAILLSDGRALAEAQYEGYFHAIHGVCELLLKDLPDKKGIRMK